MLNYDLEELAECLDMELKDVQKLYYGFKNKGDEAKFDAFCESFNIDRYILLAYAHDWKKNAGSLSKDLPFPMRILGNDGNLSDERFWFQNAWFEDNFKSEDNVAVMKISDNTLTKYGFNRGDIVVVSRLPGDILCKTHHIYMIKEQDGSIFPRVSDVISVGGGKYNRILRNPMDKNDFIPFAPLPEGYAMIGRIVWKGGLL